ncbi:hypothetical protein ANN_23419 [Periplaneta americana]|uniref:Uncharacterized protein n=1 Tax=Periplaneta americana TaxID=6978 RepID=A0ABQ8SL35_PERAM|nr:hypothetical protein ANN_23419 [Periplaneta americana]
MQSNQATGSIQTKRKKNRQRRVLTKETLVGIGNRLEQSPRKSLRSLSQQVRISYGSVRKATELLKDQGIDADIEEICVKSLKPRYGGLLNGRIGIESLTTQVLLKRSEEIEITGCHRGCDNAGEMSPGSSTESYPAFARIGLRENPGKNLNQVTCPVRDSNPGHLVSQPDALTVTPQSLDIHEGRQINYILKSAIGVAQSVKALACYSEVALERGFDPRLG